MAEPLWKSAEGVVPGTSIPDRFAHQAKLTPEAPAIRFGDKTLSYAELAQRVDGMAALLVARGFQAGQRVALCVARDERTVAYLLAIQRAGGAYVPLDARLPKSRVETILSDVRPAFSIVDQTLDSAVDAPGRIDADIFWQESETAPSDDFESIVEAERIAYMLFTSGSTGRPKGVMISHRALDAFLVGINHTLELGSGDLTLAGSTLSFDISVAELFLPLITGGTVLLSRSVDEPSEICALCAEHPVRFMWTTPSKWRALIRAGLRAAPGRKAFTGGESLPPDLVANLLPLVGELWNSYGPTECTVAATLDRVQPAPAPISIGHAIPSAVLSIVDDNLVPVPQGEVGELLIGGPCVGSGYWERPELTQAVFLEDPPGSPVPTQYRSGDLARQLSDGRFVFLGRRDRQVKVRGHRIELGEIEAEALTHETIVETAADLRSSKIGDARLVLYYATESGLPLPGSELRTYLRERIPGHALPQHYVHIAGVPLTPGGKVDLAALPDPLLDRNEREELVSPRSPFERRLHQLFCAELGISRISIRDSFFDLGGQSIMAAAIFAQMHTSTGIDLPLARLLDSPTIEGLALLFEQHAEAQSQQPDWSGLVRFKEQDDEHSVFFIHAAGGNVLNYAPIAERIQGASVYGIQARGLDGLTPPPATVAQIARNYADLIHGELKANQRESAVICGGSFGGSIAVEVAGYLRDAGVAIPLVILLDAVGPHASHPSKKRSLFRYPSLKGLSARMNRLWRSSAAAYYRLRAKPLPNAIRHDYLMDRHSALLEDFRRGAATKVVYDAPALLIRAPLAESPSDDVYADPDLGWGGGLTGELELIYVNASHEVFVEHPDTVDAVCAALRRLGYAQ